MKDFLLELIAAVGGALGMTLIFLRFAKGLIQKWVETTIETTAEKSLAKYSNVLERRTKAYEMLLDKEFGYFENATGFTSDLVINIQDYSYYIGAKHNYGDFQDLGRAKKAVLTILESFPKFKRDTLLAQSFLPADVLDAATKLSHDLDEITPFFYQALVLVSEDNFDEASKEKVKNNEFTILNNCALLTLRIKQRLEELSAE